MKCYKSLLITLAAFALMAIGTSTSAFAQFGGGGGDQLCDSDGTNCYSGCSVDSDCSSGQTCNRFNGICETASCGMYAHSNYGPTWAVFDEDPGSNVVITGGGFMSYMNTSYTRSCPSGDECGQTYYKSRAVLDTSSCGRGQCPDGWDYNMCDGCAATDNGRPAYSRHLLKKGKYTVVRTGKSCSWNGGVIVELLPCNC